MSSRHLLAITLASLAFNVGCGDTDGSDEHRWPHEESCDAVTADIPLPYRIISDEHGPSAVMIETEGGDVVMKFTPWGAHAEPHTGHPGGDIKANWQGYLAPSRADLEELTEVKDGVCDEGETCGLPEATVLARRPRYIAPDDGLVVTSVLLDRVHEPGFYYGTLNHWRIETELCAYHYSFGHVGWIAEDLRAAIIAAGDPDPEGYTGPTSVNLLSKPIVLPRGATIAIPQIVGQTDDLFPGMVVGDVWAQMEVPTRNLSTDREEPIYSWLEPPVQAALQAILWREMQDPASRTYTSWVESRSWLWKAESALYWAEFASRDDYSGFVSESPWFENLEDGGDCTDGDPLCDQALSIWPITKTGPIYDASLYDSPATSFLVMKSQRGGTYFRGEVLQAEALGLSGTMLIKWRLEDYLHPIERYQKVSFSLSPHDETLKLHWSVESEDRSALESAADPAVPTDLSCDGSAVTCMNHDWHYGASFMPGY